jgi:hypothetical protein
MSQDSIAQTQERPKHILEPAGPWTNLTALPFCVCHCILILSVIRYTASPGVQLLR